jgi:hypothetical protein
MAQSLRDTLLQSIKALLRPIIRFALNHGVKLQEVSELAKAVFIEEGILRLKNEKIPFSMSRLSAMTGVHRKDVTRLYKEGDEIKQDSNLMIRIIGHWQTSNKFVSSGKPKLLNCEGKQSEFADLVYSVSADLNPYTVLFELERSGHVKKINDKVRLESKVFATADIKEGLSILSADISDVMQSVESNLFDKPDVPDLHIRTYFDNIVIAKLPEIRNWLLHRGAKFQRDVREYLTKFDKDCNPEFREDEGGGKIAVGVFGRVEEEPAAPIKRRKKS